VLIACIVILAAAALATALSASFSTHASTVCMSVSFIGSTAFQMGCIVSSSWPKQTRGNVVSIHRKLYMIYIDCSAQERGKHVGRFRMPYRPVQNEGWVSKERGARTGSLFQQGYHIPHCSLRGRREDAQSKTLLHPTD